MEDLNFLDNFELDVNLFVDPSYTLPITLGEEDSVGDNTLDNELEEQQKLFLNADLGATVKDVIIPSSSQDTLETPFMLRCALLQNKFVSDPSSHYNFLFYHTNSKTMSKEKTHMALLRTHCEMTFSKKWNETFNGAYMAKNYTSRVVVQRAFGTLASLRKSYQGLLSDDGNSVTTKEIINLIDIHNVVPIEPMRTLGSDGKLHIYKKTGNELRDNMQLLSITDTERKKNAVVVGEEIPAYDENNKLDTAIYVQINFNGKASGDSIYHVYFSENDKFVRCHAVTKWVRVSKKQFVTDYINKDPDYATNNNMELQEKFLNDDDVIHVFITYQIEKFKIHLKKTGVFAMYFPLQHGLHAFALAEKMDDSDVALKAHFLEVISTMKKPLPANLEHVRDYIVRHNRTHKNDVTNWLRGLNLNGEPLCDYYLERLGIGRRRYDEMIRDNKFDYEEFENQLYSTYNNSKTNRYKPRYRINPQSNGSAVAVRMPIISLLATTTYYNKEMMPARLNWMPDCDSGLTYGRGHCHLNGNDCNCYIATFGMLRQLTSYNFNVRTVTTHNEYNFVLPYPVSKYTPSDHFDRMLVDVFKNCKVCGNTLGSDECKRKCRDVHELEVKAIRERYAQYEKLLKNLGSVKTKRDCAECPLFLLNDPNLDKPYDLYPPKNSPSDPSHYFGDYIAVNFTNNSPLLNPAETSDPSYAKLNKLFVALLSLSNAIVVIDDPYKYHFTNFAARYMLNENPIAIEKDNIEEKNIHAFWNKIYEEQRLRVMTYADYMQYTSYADKCMTIFNKPFPTSFAEQQSLKKTMSNAPCINCVVKSNYVEKVKRVHVADPIRPGDPGFNDSGQFRECFTPPLLDDSTHSDIEYDVDEFVKEAHNADIITVVDKLATNKTAEYAKHYGPSLGAEIEAIVNSNIDDDDEW